MKSERKKKAVQKILCVALAAAMLGVYAETALPVYTGTGVVAKAATSMDVEAGDDYKWKENQDGSVTVTDYTGNGGDVVIPSEIDGKPVTSIGKRAFKDCTGLTSVTIPDSVTSIGDDAFSDCTGLTVISVDKNNESYTSEDGVLFDKNKTTLMTYPQGKKGAYTIPDSVTSIGKRAFSDCAGLTDVTIPDSVTSIGDGAFVDCIELKNVTIPDSVTSIGEEVFFGCTGLTSVTIPDSVTDIGSSAFYGCTGLTSVIIPGSVTKIEAFLFSECTGLTSVTIPDSVTSIGYYAFKDCTGLTSVTIPDSVTSISDDTFSGCTGLAVINVDKNNESYTSEDGVLFDKNKTNLIIYPVGKKGAYTIPDSVTEIGSSAFDGCIGLTSVTIPDSVTSIGYGAFFGCTGLTDVTIPDSVTSISSLAFYNCTGLTSVIIPGSVTSIGSSAFYGCDNITIHGYKNSYAETYANENGITFAEIDVETADDYEWKENEDGTVTITGYTGNGGDVVIPSEIDGKSVTSIGNWAFEDCTGLTSVTIPGSVTKIGNWAFFRCTGLTDVKISDSVTEIGMAAFYGCTGLTSITIPDSVTNIGMAVFFGCTGLTSIDVDKNNENYLSESGIVFNKDKTALILYPVGRIGDYTIPDSVTSIGTSAFVDCTGLTSITIPDSVTEIGMGAFAGCSGLTSITIPDSVTKIGAEAFSYCTGLTSIDVDKNNENYLSENGVLFNKDKTSLIAYPGGKNGAYTVPGSVTEIGAGAFADCTGLTSITVPDSVTSIGDYAFSHCTGLTNITIPASVTEISDGIFAGCDDIVIFGYSGSYAETYANENELAFVAIDADYEWEENEDGSVTITGYTGNGGDVVIPYVIDGKPVTSIGNWAFDSCIGLTSITIPDSVTSIGDGAFADCTGLTVISVDKNNESYTSEDGVLFDKNKTTLIRYPGGKKGAYTIPGSVTSIGYVAFADCPGLTDVTIPGSVTSIDDGAFLYCPRLTSITIPDSVTSIGYSAFFDCTGLTVISVDKNNESYTSEDGVLFDKNKTTLITYPGGKEGAYTIPGSVTSIGDRAFGYCKGLTSITIPDSVTSIGYSAFVVCKGLTSVTIPDSVTEIGLGAFADCTGLTEINVGQNNESYTSEDGILFDKNKTTLIIYPAGKKGAYTIPGSVTSIGDGAFGYCKGLTNTTIPASVIEIGSDAFYGCDNVTIYGYKNSYAETYAKDNDIPFVAIEEPIVTPTEITLDTTRTWMGRGETYQLSATVSPNNAADKSITWTSSNNNIATVSNGKVTAKKDGTVTITAKTSNGKTAECKITVQPPASKITLNKSTLYLGIGETFQLTSSVQSGTASAKRAFASSDNSICYTSGKGLLTAKKAGTVYVTVKTFNGKTAQCKVVVQPPASKITLNKSTLYLGIGETFQLTSSVQSGTASTKRAFVSSDNSICYTSGKGLLTAKKAGTVYVTVKTFNGKTAQCKVVVQPPASKITLNKSTLYLGIGETFQLTSSVQSGTASTKRAFASSDNSICYTSGNGLLTAKKAGTVYVTVKTFNGKTAQCKVVVQPPASKITLNKSTLYLGIGETFQLTSSVQSGTASTKRAFASSDNSICYTSGNGLLTAKKAGTVYVTVKTFNGKTAQCKVVVQPPAKAVHISKSWLTLHVGQKFQLSSWVEAGTASTKRAWSSSDNNTVHTSGNGLLTAKKTGTANITVKTFNGVSSTLKVKVIK